jgi:hypothetical protein
MKEFMIFYTDGYSKKISSILKESKLSENINFDGIKNCLTEENNLFLIAKGIIDTSGFEAKKSTIYEMIYTAMQGEYWSPFGEQFDYISKIDKHTSMSIGDCLLVRDKNSFALAQCSSFGFKSCEGKINKKNIKDIDNFFSKHCEKEIEITFDKKKDTDLSTIVKIDVTKNINGNKIHEYQVQIDNKKTTCIKKTNKMDTMIFPSFFEGYCKDSDNGPR